MGSCVVGWKVKMNIGKGPAGQSAKSTAWTPTRSTRSPFWLKEDYFASLEQGNTQKKGQSLFTDMICQFCVVSVAHWEWIAAHPSVANKLFPQATEPGSLQNCNFFGTIHALQIIKDCNGWLLSPRPSLCTHVPSKHFFRSLYFPKILEQNSLRRPHRA